MRDVVCLHCKNIRAHHQGQTGDGQVGHIPIFVDKLHQSVTMIIIHGDGSQTRSMSHALDIVGGLVSMLNIIDDVNGEIYNLAQMKQMSGAKDFAWNS